MIAWICQTTSAQSSVARLTISRHYEVPTTRLDRYFPATSLHFALQNHRKKNITYFVDNQRIGSDIYAVFVPKWCADDLPFFCKIEHKYLTKFPIPAIFRLGW
jgi:hypothetical protein